MFRSLKRLIAVSALGLVVAGCGVARTSPVIGGVVPLIVSHLGYEVRAYARVTIKNRTYLFVVDTGASRTLVDTSVAAALRLPSHGSKIVMHPFGCATSAQPVLASHWRVGSVVLPPTIVVTQTGDLGANVAGLRVVGLLGSDVLSHFGTATFEFQQKRLILGARAALGGDVVNLRLRHPADGDAEFIRAEINGKPVTLLVDTGAAISGIDGQLARQLRLQRLGHAGTVKGATGCTGTVRPVAIRDWTIGDLSLPSTFALAGFVSTLPGLSFQGILGADVLSTFGRVTFEFGPRHVLILSDPRYPTKPAH